MNFKKSEEKDEMLERLKDYDKNKDQIKHEKRKKEFLQEQREYGKFWEENTYVGKVLKDNDFQIFDVNQAQEDFRKVMGLDKITEIAGVYITTKFKKDMPVRTEHIERITKANYWNAFYQPIWENLSDADKIKALEWMFEVINEKYHLGIRQLDFFVPNYDDVEIVIERDLEYTKGLYDNVRNKLFINLDYLSKPLAYFEMPLTLAHEFMHARQHNYIKNYNFKNPVDFYTLSQTELGDIGFLGLTLEYKLDSATEYALYRICQSEKAAELMGLKTINKIKRLNQEKFGKNRLIDNRINAGFDNIKQEMLFEDTEKRGKDKHKRFVDSHGLLTNEEIILHGQSENLLKLIILKNFYESEKEALLYSQKETREQIDELIKKFNNDFSTYEEFWNVYGEKRQALDDEVDRLENCINEDDEKLGYIKSTFLLTLKYGKLPENFDEKTEFAPLNLIDEPKKLYSLPRWLHEDEDKNRKHLNSQKKKYEKVYEHFNEK